MRYEYLFSVFVFFILGCQDARKVEFEKLRSAHYESIPNTQKVVVEKFEKALKILQKVDLKGPSKSRNDESICDQAATQLEGAIVASDGHQDNARRVGNARPKDMLLSKSGILLSDTSRMIKEFLPKVRGCENVGKIKGMLPWVQTAAKIELDGDLKACSLAAGLE